jgi:hypothetical protein
VKTTHKLNLLTVALVGAMAFLPTVVRAADAKKPVEQKTLTDPALRLPTPPLSRRVRCSSSMADIRLTERRLVSRLVKRSSQRCSLQI